MCLIIRFRFLGEKSDVSRVVLVGIIERFSKKVSNNGVRFFVDINCVVQGSRMLDPIGGASGLISKASGLIGRTSGLISRVSGLIGRASSLIGRVSGQIGGASGLISEA